MAKQLTQEEARADALQQALLGQALMHTGVKHGDLSLVRSGKKHQAEAAAKGVTLPPSSKPPRQP